MNQRLVFIVDEAHRSQFGEMQRVIKQHFQNKTGTGLQEHRFLNLIKRLRIRQPKRNLGRNFINIILEMH